MTSSKPSAAGFTKHKEIMEVRCARPSEMVERVARAIRSDLWSASNVQKVAAGNASIVGQRFRAIEQARAAIEAMRHHSPEQEERMRVLLGENTPATRRWHWVWWEMIDAALTPPSAGLPPKHKERG